MGPSSMVYACIQHIIHEQQGCYRLLLVWCTCNCKPYSISINLAIRQVEAFTWILTKSAGALHHRGQCSLWLYHMDTIIQIITGDNGVCLSPADGTAWYTVHQGQQIIFFLWGKSELGYGIALEDAWYLKIYRPDFTGIFHWNTDNLLSERKTNTLKWDIRPESWFNSRTVPKGI